ncbi:MAG: DJ-1/PfpI family protein [Hyphomicrobiales bacterium]|nr:MAG: DJ-1/PfpI family protein [Hyphomicrobiales bacterium]
MTGDITRRDWTGLAAAGALSGLLAALPQTALAQAAGTSTPRIAMLVHPDMVMLDLVGPLTVFSLLRAELHLVWKDRQPVANDLGLPVTPTTSYADCPAELDVLFIPGGLKGSVALMEDAETLAFLADRGTRARYVTAVCTGSLVLGAAGLLKGYRATGHWYIRDLLASMGASVEYNRVVTDRNRITGGGVTAGIDFGLTVAAKLRDEETARLIQFVLEYDPQPPFDAGSPERAGAKLTGEVLARRKPLIDAARRNADLAKIRLSL